VTVAWDAIKVALVDHLARVRVVPPEHIFWEREASPIAFDDVLELRFSDERALGYDDVRQELTTAGSLAPRITGVREFTLSIRFHSRSQVTAARNALERVRASFHHPAWVSTLCERGVGFLSTEQIQTFDDVFDARWESIAVLDVHFCTVSNFFQDVLDPPPDDEFAGAIPILQSVVFTTRDDMPPDTPPVLVDGTGRRVVP
jgi:hypothetical protein